MTFSPAENSEMNTLLQMTDIFLMKIKDQSKEMSQ